jgi:hypothetical protein
MKAIVLHWNNPDGARRTVSSLIETAPGVPVCVVDNASAASAYARVTDGLPGDVHVVRLPRNLGYAGGMNWALRHLIVPQEELALLCSHSVVFMADCVALLTAAARRSPRYAALGPALPRAADRATALPARPSGDVVDCAWVTGAALLVRPSAVLDIGGFDEDLFAYFEDVDLCERLRSAGWQVGYVPAAGAEETGSVLTARERIYLTSRNHIKCARKAGRLRMGWVALRKALHVVRAGAGSLAPWRLGERRQMSRDFAVGQAWGVVDGVTGKSGPGRARLCGMGDGVPGSVEAR